MTNIAFTVVISSLAAANPEWSSVADALITKHSGEAVCEKCVVENSVTNALGRLRASRPRAVAFVMSPKEVRFGTLLDVKRMMREIDEDPYEDAIWGVVTGPTAKDALRIASSRGPERLSSSIATTGVSEGMVSGEIVCFSDANPPGNWYEKLANGKIERHSTSNDLSRTFADAWERIDPEFIVTSGHASQRNLEMPFSRGNIVPRDGRFMTAPNRRLINYSTGQALAGADGAATGVALAETKNEKVWIAVGNCLIANHPKKGESMIMTALGFGKVNQFIGYETTTWFGDIGWKTLTYFASYHYSAVLSHYASKQYLLKRLNEDIVNAADFKPRYSDASKYDRMINDIGRFPARASKPISDTQRIVGLFWDRDATIFYGDPLVQCKLDSPSSDIIKASGENPLPRIVIFDKAESNRVVKAPSSEWELFVADDFALILKWPEHRLAEESALSVSSVSF